MEKDVIITYESLYELLRREKSRPELQRLDQTFFNDVLKYLEEKKAIVESQGKKDSIFGSLEVEKTKKQLENIKKIIKEIYEKRESKIMQLALISSRTNNINNFDTMLPEEMVFYDELTNVLSSSRDSILNNILNLRQPSKSEPVNISKPKDINMDPKGEGNKLIRILNPLPKFMGTNLEVYGPFDQENVVNLPSEIANLLIKNRKAEEIKT